MNILITGANGQLGNELKKLENNYSGWNFFYGDLPEVDITNKTIIEEFTQQNNIKAIINCAAYTAVDKAEEDKELANKVNAIGPSILAKIAYSEEIQLIHVSTDFVFDGKNFQPYVENDKTAPISAYGETKLNGEQLVLKNCPSAIILRTSWLYSSFGNNFVKTMQRLGSERDQLNVIFDQIGTPTYAADLAGAILKILNSNEQKAGIFHYSNEGVASWYDFAKAIMELSNIECKVFPIPTSMYPTPAARPHYSVMNKQKIKDTFKIEIPYWRESLKTCIQELKGKTD